MFIMHVALGGCLKAPPVDYGITADTGGHISYVLNAATAMIAQEEVERVEIVTRRFAEPALGEIYARPREEVAPGIEIVRLGGDRDRYEAKGRLASSVPLFTARLMAYLEGLERRPDVIHAHFADAAEAALAARARFGGLVFYTPHSLAADRNSVPADGDDDLARRIAAERLAIRRSDAVIVSSRDEAERQVPLYDSGASGWVHRVPPGVTLRDAGADLEGARALLSPFLRDPDRPLILAIARPVAKKNLGGLLRAYASSEALKAQANVAILAGLRRSVLDADDAQAGVVSDLFDVVDRNDLWGRVALPRWHGQAEINGLYALAARSGGVFVNPAFAEPFGLTIVEAAASGLPVVATRHGGPADIVAEIGHGRLVDPLDHEAIAQACLGLITDRAEWFEASAAGRAGARMFCWEGYARRVLEIVRTLRRPIRRFVAPSRLVATDIDATLTGHEGAAGEFRLWAESRRVPFVVATGRSVGEALIVLDRWRLPCPDAVIASVGSEVYVPDTSGRLCLDEDYASAIAADWRPDAIRDALAALPGIVPQPPIEMRRFKLSYIGDAEAAGSIRATLADRGIAARIVHSHRTLIDVLPARAGKAAAVAHVARGFGLTLADCIAAGDSGNDLDLLQGSGRAIVVGNASQELAGLTRSLRVYRSRRPYAGGVLEGLARFGVAEGRNDQAAVPLQAGRPLA